MSEKFSRIYEKEDIDAIMTSVFSSGKVKREGMFSTNRTNLLLDGIMNANTSKVKILPINMRKLAAYNNVIAKTKENIKANTKPSINEFEVLPLVLRKRVLLEKKRISLEMKQA